MERLPGHTMDVGVNLSRMFSMKAGGDSSSLVPGSLASPGVEKEDEKLVSLVFSSENEWLNLLHKYLVEASPKKKTDSGMQFVTGSTLETDMKYYIGDYDTLLSCLSTLSWSQCAASCLA